MLFHIWHNVKTCIAHLHDIFTIFIYINNLYIPKYMYINIFGGGHNAK